MPAVPRLIALGAFLCLLALVAVFAYMLILRYHGRQIPRTVARVAGALVGASHGLAALFATDDPVFLVAVLAVPAYAVYWLVRRGQRRTAGILLVIFGLPGVLWWGGFGFRDLLDPHVDYEPDLWPWAAAAIAVLVVGVWLFVQRDRDLPAEPLIRRAPSHLRDPAAVGSAIRQALLFGPFPLPSLIAEGVGLLLIVIGIPLALKLGFPAVIAWVTGAIVFAFVGTGLWFIALPRRIRRAWEGFAAIGNPEMKRWRSTTWTDVPTSLPAMKRWLEEHPERPETRWARAEALAVIGELDEARAVIDRMEATSEFERFERSVLTAYVDWLSGADPDLNALQREADGVGDPRSEERLMARGLARIALARDLATRGGDWMAPLFAIRDSAPNAPALFREDVWKPRFRRVLLFGGLYAGLITLVTPAAF